MPSMWNEIRNKAIWNWYNENNPNALLIIDAVEKNVGLRSDGPKFKA